MSKSTKQSGYTGVIWNASQRQWVAQIYINHEMRYLGAFDTIDEAVQKRIEAKEQFGKNGGRALN